MTEPSAMRRARQRSGFAGLAGAASKADGRQLGAQICEERAKVIGGWTTDGAPPGGDLDPAMVALVAAYLHKHSPAEVAIREWASSRGRTGGPPASDAIGFIRWILEIS